MIDKRSPLGAPLMLPVAAPLIFGLAPCGSAPESPTLISKLALVLVRGPPCVARVPLAMFIETGAYGGACSHGGPRINSGGARPGAGRPRRESPIEIARDMLGWFVVRTEFERERSADIAIRLTGVTVFNPSIWRPESPARRDRGGTMRPARPARIASLFPRFLFARLDLADPAWHDIKRIAGVERIMGRVGDPGRPALVPDATILLIRSMLEPNDCLYLGGYDGFRHRTPLEVGTAQRVLSGAFEGQQGIVAWSDHKCARLMVSILGGSFPLTVSRGELEPV